MKVKTAILATAFAITGSLALAQPAPIGSSADFGNGAVINRGPVWTVGEDMDFRTDRTAPPRVIAPYPHHHHYHRHHVAEHGH